MGDRVQGFWDSDSIRADEYRKARHVTPECITQSWGTSFFLFFFFFFNLKIFVIEDISEIGVILNLLHRLTPISRRKMIIDGQCKQGQREATNLTGLWMGRFILDRRKRIARGLWENPKQPWLLLWGREERCRLARPRAVSLRSRERRDTRGKSPGMEVGQGKGIRWTGRAMEFRLAGRGSGGRVALVCTTGACQ